LIKQLSDGFSPQASQRSQSAQTNSPRLVEPARPARIFSGNRRIVSNIATSRSEFAQIYGMVRLPPLLIQRKSRCVSARIVRAMPYAIGTVAGYLHKKESD
jgi:hypothetical protein